MKAHTCTGLEKRAGDWEVVTKKIQFYYSGERHDKQKPALSTTSQICVLFQSCDVIPMVFTSRRGYHSARRLS